MTFRGWTCQMFEAPYRVFWEEQLLKREKGQTAGRPLLSFTLTD